MKHSTLLLLLSYGSTQANDTHHPALDHNRALTNKTQNLATTNIINLTSKNIAEVLQQGKPVVIKAHATWCGPCTQIAPLFEELAQDYKEHVIFASLDVDAQQELAKAYGITKMPTFLFIKKGKVTQEQVGSVNKECFKGLIEQLLKD